MSLSTNIAIFLILLVTFYSLFLFLLPSGLWLFSLPFFSLISYLLLFFEVSCLIVTFTPSPGAMIFFLPLGYQCFVLLSPHKCDKLSACAVPCVFFGINPEHCAYRCYDSPACRFRILRHNESGKFLTFLLWFKTLVSSRLVVIVLLFRDLCFPLSSTGSPLFRNVPPFSSRGFNAPLVYEPIVSPTSSPFTSIPPSPMLPRSSSHIALPPTTRAPLFVVYRLLSANIS